MPRGKKAEGGITKIDAVREIIGNHGKDTMPTEIARLAKSEHGVVLTPGTASNYKTTVVKELMGGKSKARRGPKPGWKRTTTNGRGTVSIDDIAAVKKLVEQLGAEKVEQLARVLAK